MTYTDKEFKEAVEKLAKIDQASQQLKEQLRNANDELLFLKGKLLELQDHPIKRIRTYLGWNFNAKFCNALRELLNELGYLGECCKRNDCNDCLGQGVRQIEEPKPEPVKKRSRK